MSDSVRGLLGLMCMIDWWSSVFVIRERVWFVLRALMFVFGATCCMIVLQLRSLWNLWIGRHVVESCRHVVEMLCAFDVFIFVAALVVIAHEDVCCSDVCVCCLDVSCSLIGAR